MTIVASGEISLGGNATATRSVACELFRSGTAAICMDESAVRTLAARTTAASAICMNDFYSKSNAPTALGQSFAGGYYLGTVTSPANYYLIVAPNATGCAGCQWKTTNTASGPCNNATCNCNNGYWSTFTYLNNTAHPMGNFTATRSIGGFTDWYLPARNELNVLYTNKSSLPTGQKFSDFDYWSSSERSPVGVSFPIYGFTQYFGTGFQGFTTKTTFGVKGRAVRRIPF